MGVIIGATFCYDFGNQQNSPESAVRAKEKLVPHSHVVMLRWPFPGALINHFQTYTWKIKCMSTNIYIIASYMFQGRKFPNLGFPISVPKV